MYIYNKGLLCCSFLLIFYYEFYYSFYYKAAENRGKQRITEDNGTFTEYREKAQKRYVSGLLKWLYHIVHERIIHYCKTCICFHLLPRLSIYSSFFVLVFLSDCFSLSSCLFQLALTFSSDGNKPHIKCKEYNNCNHKQ